MSRLFHCTSTALRVLLPSDVIEAKKIVMYYIDKRNGGKDLQDLPFCSSTTRFELLSHLVQHGKMKQDEFRFEEHIGTYDVLDRYICSRFVRKTSSLVIQNVKTSGGWGTGNKERHTVSTADRFLKPLRKNHHV